MLAALGYERSIPNGDELMAGQYHNRQEITVELQPVEVFDKAPTKGAIQEKSVAAQIGKAETATNAKS